MLYNTGARVSEIIGVRVADVVLDGAACVHLHGKGRKQRSVPLWARTVAEVRAWLRLESDAAQRSRLAAQSGWAGDVAIQRRAAPGPRCAPRGRASSPASSRSASHRTCLRHTTAMHLLQSGVPFNVIALWLGHESATTTHRYVEADLAMKEKALARLEAPDTKFAGSRRRTR